MSDTKLTGFYHPWPNLGVKLSRQWEKLRDNTEKEAPLIRAAYVDAQPSSANDPGNHDLSGWAIGERDFRNRFRIWYDKTNDRFSIQYNSGTEAVEVWDDYLSIRQVDGRVTVHGYGGLDSAAGGFYTTVPRNLAISRTFTPAAREWVFDHNLDTKPILWNAFNLEDKSVTPTTVDVSNPNIAYFYFPALQAGRAIVVAEQARGEGIRITDGVNVFPAANRLSFNRHDFYLSKEGHGAPVVNLQPIDLSGTQHGNLGALTADDHPQYARTDGTRTITGDQRFASDIVVEDKATAGSFYSPTFGEVAYANQGYLSVTQTNGSPLFSTVNSLKFEHQNFYLTADSDGKPIVNFRGVGGGSGGGQFGTGLESESFSSSTQWAFNHGLGTANVIWSVYDNQGYAVIPDKVSTHDPNIAYFYFSPATAGKVVIAGGPLVNTITVKGNTGAAWNRSTDTLNFNPAHFYITATATGKPIINAQPSAGGGVTDHGALTGLLDDDHSQYSLASGSRAFTGTVGGISPTAAAHLATKGYVDIRFSNFYNDLGGVTDHGALTGLADDDHSQYILADGTRAFTGPVTLPSGSVGSPALNIGEAGTGVYLPASGNLDLALTGGFIGARVTAFGLQTPDGIASNPSHTFINDTDTGLFLKGANVLGISARGAEQGYLDENGLRIHNEIRAANFYLTSGGELVNDHGALTGLADDDHSQYLLASDATNRATFAANWTDLTDGGATTLHSHAVADHGTLSGLSDDDHPQYLLRTEASPGFYGVNFRETDGNPPAFRNDTLIFDSKYFYLQGDSTGKPTVSLRPTAGGGAGVSDHGALTGLSDDDHPQYLLASAATNRATFAANWTDLTDGGETSLHSHAGGSGSGGGFYGVNFRETDGGPDFRNDTIYFDSESFYLHPNSVGKPVLSFRGAASGGAALTVKDIDGNPTVSNVSTLQFTNGSVTDQGSGVAEVTLSAGGGISTLTEGSKSFGSQTTLGFNSHHFYLSPGGTAGSKVLNLRYNKEIIPVFQELVTVSNFAIDPFVPYPYTIETVDIDCKSGSCVAAFYILAANARNKNGKSIVGLDPIAVSTSVARKVATANNSVNPGDCLMLSIPSNTTAKHLRISITAKKPN